jgi:hypothetical protein
MKLRQGAGTASLSITTSLRVNLVWPAFLDVLFVCFIFVVVVLLCVLFCFSAKIKLLEVIYILY